MSLQISYEFHVSTTVLMVNKVDQSSILVAVDLTMKQIGRFLTELFEKQEG